MGTATLIWIVLIILIILTLQNRSAAKRVGEDIDEIRNSLYELRSKTKELQADWNIKLARIHTEVLKTSKKIPKDRIPYIITKDCIACGSCIPECPTDAILEGLIFEIKPELCIACGKCAVVCPVRACLPMEEPAEPAKEEKKTAKKKSGKSTGKGKSTAKASEKKVKQSSAKKEEAEKQE